MLQVFGSGLLALWLKSAGIHVTTHEKAWLGVPGSARWVANTQSDRQAEAIVDAYLKQLQQQQQDPARQGIWIQDGWRRLADRNGTEPRSAASLTKIATSLAALREWGPNYQFLTIVAARGEVENGVLKGDLVVKGGGDPDFLWEDAIAVGNALNEMGIRQVTGNLVVENRFAMNFEFDPQKAGEALKLGLNRDLWAAQAPDAIYVRGELPEGTPQPKVEILGTVVAPAVSSQRTWGDGGSTPVTPTTRPELGGDTLLLNYPSLKLVEILKEMNVYSNNNIAHALADSLGGGEVVMQEAIAATGVPETEIQLVNGSGLGQENQVSPRAACAMLVAIEQILTPMGVKVGEAFPVSGQDIGTLEFRNIPPGSAVKTGTLWNVSALAGFLPTRDRGSICFAIVNGGEDFIEPFRESQDELLKALQNHYGSPKD